MLFIDNAKQRHLPPWHGKCPLTQKPSLPFVYMISDSFESIVTVRNHLYQHNHTTYKYWEYTGIQDHIA